MNRNSAKIVLLACFVFPLAGCGQGGGGGAAAQADDSPEGQAFDFRNGVMHSLAWKVGKLRAMAQGDIPVDNAVALKNAQDTAALAGMLTDGFIPNSMVKGSLALPDIWKNFPDFQMKANDLQMAAAALADATKANGFEASKGMVQAVGQSCGGCHRPYRKRTEQ
jgi:cytochrome c556